MTGRRALPALLALVLAGDLAAQDANYWTYQYGTRANLLSGAVVGSVVDLGAAFYNPGALTLIKDPDIISTQKVLELSNVTFRPDVGFELDFNDLRLDLAPGYVAGILPFRFLANHVLAYSFFTRYLFKASLDGARVGRLEELADTLSGDFFAQTRSTRDLNETWGGLSWSFPLAQKVGFGVSLFGAYRSQSGMNRTQGQTLSEDGTLGIGLTENDFSYWHFRLLWKAGVTFEWMGASLGLTVTAPGIGLFGDGRVLVNRTLSNSDTVFVADYQRGLKPDYRSPWSVAFGGSYRRNKTVLHLTAERYSKVEEYKVLDPADFVGQSTGDTIAGDLTLAADDVLNFGIGIQQDFREHLTGFASFRTDYSSKSPESSNDIAIASWDILYVTAGAAFRVGTADLTLGLAYGWGDKRDEDVGVRFDDELVEPPRTADLKYRSLRLIIAFAI